MANLQQPLNASGAKAIPTPADLSKSGITPDAILTANMTPDLKIQILQQYPGYLERHGQALQAQAQAHAQAMAQAQVQAQQQQALAMLQEYQKRQAGGQQ